MKINLYYIALGILVFPLIFLSGFIELMPFLNSTPSQYYASYPIRIIQDIREKTNQQAVFLSYSSKEIHLAGRKLWLGLSIDEPGAASFLVTSGFNIKSRERVMENIYQSNSINNFCSLTTKNNIDFVVLDRIIKYKFRLIDANFPKFTSINEQGEKIIFLDVKGGCGKILY